MRHPDIEITKASGKKDSYNREKLRSSLLRSGGKDEIVEKVIAEVESHLTDGMSTRKIYRKAFQVLRKNSVYAASRYQLKHAIMDLGPSGYPFEQYIARIFEAKGHKTEVGRVVNGICVQHELDVIAWQNNQVAIAECKFRNQPGSKTDVKVALYFHSRFNDVVAAWRKDNGASWRSLGLGGPNDDNPQFEGWLVTNAKFTIDAINYAKCSGIKLLGWDYPHDASLIKAIEETQIMPITMLQALSKHDKTLLLDEGVTVCHDLQNNADVMTKLGIDKSRIRRTQNELDVILS